MNRSHNDFTLIVDMPPGRYQYKFIVDNTWCATCSDGNSWYSPINLWLFL
jgi:hypothetical protein